MTAFWIDPLEVFDQQKSWPTERQCQEGIDKCACNLRLCIVAQSLARARFSNDEQGFKLPAIACLDVQFRERLANMVIRRQAACSEHVVHQGAGSGKCRNSPLYGAIKDAASPFRCQRVGHHGCRKTALANTWFAQQGHGAAFAAQARESFTK